MSSKSSTASAKIHGRIVVTPINKDPRKMTNWKLGFEYKPEPKCKDRNRAVSRGPVETTSRLRRMNAQASPLKKKGNFQKKNKVTDAPDLVAVVAARPDLKERAKEEAQARQTKMEEYRKKKSITKMIVRKPSLKQARGEWTNILKNCHYSNKNKAKRSPNLSKTSKKSRFLEDKSSSDIENDVVVQKQDNRLADWTAVYQDILSPTSGNHKLVAKQDLSVSEKVHSPKKKKRESPKPASFPVCLPLADDLNGTSNHNTGRSCDETISKASTKTPLLSIDLSNESCTGSRSSSASASMQNGERSLTRSKNRDVIQGQPQREIIDLKEFEDFTENTADDQDEETPIDLASTQHTEEEINANEVKQNDKKQLILEFAMPAFADEFTKKEIGEDGGLEVPVETLSFDDVSSVDSWPSIESCDSYDTKMKKMIQRWMDVDDGGEEGVMYQNGVELDDNVLDHVVLAAPDLEEAMAQFEQMTGISPTVVGPLQGLGAKTAHVGLDHNRYIEILAPDGYESGPLGEELQMLEKGTLTPYAHAIRSSEVSRLIEGYVYDVLGWDPDHIAMVQALPDNSKRQWDLLTMYGHDVGGCAPYYVKWSDPTHHPTANIPTNARLVSCRVRAPANHDVHKLITGVRGIDVEHGHPLLECTLETPRGAITFSADRPRGLKFPGYDDEHRIADPMPDLVPASLLGSLSDSDWADIGYESESTDNF